MNLFLLSTYIITKIILNYHTEHRVKGEGVREEGEKIKGIFFTAVAVNLCIAQHKEPGYR